MARFGFRRTTAATRGTAVTFRMMNLPGSDDAAGSAGWYESSAELARGLLVIEGAPVDPFDAWFSAQA